MAFVDIVKEDKVLSIPKGAYAKQYAPYGWELVGTTESAPEEQVEDGSDDEWEAVEAEALLERPLSDLKFEELKTVAKYKGIKVQGMNGRQLREAIKATM